MGKTRTEISGFIDPVLSEVGGGGGQSALHTVSALDPKLLIPMRFSRGERELLSKLGLTESQQALQIVRRTSC